jgi:hypothetical protein
MPFVRKTLMEQLPRTGSGFSRNEDYDEFKQLLRDIVEEQQPMTVRQVYYRAVVKGYVEKTGQGYGYVQRDLVYMRKNNMMPYEWIDDRTRSMRGWQGLNQSVDEFMDGVMEDIPYRYFQNLLADHEFSIQVWLEKEALVGIVEPMTRKWNVPLIPARGYASITLLHDAAKDLERKDRPAKIFQFGDYDPSGQDALRAVQDDLPLLAPKTAKKGIEFHIVAVTPEQIEEMNLPTRPKKITDPRSKSFESDENVELDAIEPDVLRRMVDEVLQAQFPPDAQKENERLQEEGREEIRRRLQELLRDDD